MFKDNFYVLGLLANKMKKAKAFKEKVNNGRLLIAVAIAFFFASGSPLSYGQNSPVSPGDKTAINQHAVLVFNSHGEDWESESLPLGNGLLGATIAGGVTEDVIQFNEKTLWTGGPGKNGPYQSGLPDDTSGYAEQVEAVVKEIAEKGSLSPEYVAGKLGHQQPDYGSYQSFADLVLSFPENTQDIHGYRRSLDLNTAVATVSYSADKIDYKRDYFVTYPDNSIVIRLTASDKGALNVSAKLRFPENRTWSAEGRGQDTLLYSGALTDNGLEFAAGMRILHEGGTTDVKDAEFRVKNADSVTILLTAATNYALRHPDYRLGHAKDKVTSQLSHLRNFSFDELLTRHLNDYQPLFNRVRLDLGDGETGELKAALKAYPSKNESHNRALESLYFHYGRYLLIASSRAGSLPANLQGIWNKDIQAPWSADYHLNINLQMNYWLAHTTNLPETLPPLFDFVENLTIPGREAAGSLFGAAGWVVFLNTNPWGSTGLIDWPTAFWQPEAAAWIARHFYEEVAFNADESFLKERAWPLLKLTSQFWLDNLVESADSDTLLISPSYSPEHGDFTAGAAMSQQIVTDLFANTLTLAEQVGDGEFAAALKSALERLEPGLRIGTRGQLQEWRQDIDDEENRHRHISHLFALHPGNHISPVDTPSLSKAAAVSLNARGDGGTGWSRAWKINFWARLADGNRALQLLQAQLRDSTLSNMWSSHPPFQIDGNFGATAGIAEMLLQSHRGELHLLPALPDAWEQGRVTGLRARGNREVSMGWSDGRLNKAMVKTFTDGEIRIRCDSFDDKITVTANGKHVAFTSPEQGVISFTTSAQQEYAVSAAE